MRVLLRCVAIMSTFLVAASLPAAASGGSGTWPADFAVNALPDRIWIAPGETWTLNWQSAVSPAAGSQASVGSAPPGSAPIACCSGSEPLRINLALPGQPVQQARIEVVRYRPLPADMHPAFNVMTIGDSLSEVYLPTALRQALEGLGYRPTMIGTTTGRPWGGTADQTEGRGGKQLRDMLYQRTYSPTDISTVRPVPIGGEAQYLALPQAGLSVVTRKYFNPFLRPASGSRFRGTIQDDHLTVTAVQSGFVGLGQTLRLDDGPRSARIVGFVRGQYGGAGEYLLDHALPHRSEELVSDECGTCVNNDTVFDVRFYLSRFGLADPDWVMISAGTNDMFSVHAGPGGAETLAVRIQDGLNSLRDAFRLALPRSRIVFYNVTLGAGPGHDQFEPMQRTLQAATRDTVRSFHDPHAYWVNAGIWQSEAHGWWVHPEGEDMTNEARALAALIAAEQNPAGHDIAR